MKHTEATQQLINAVKYGAKLYLYIYSSAYALVRCDGTSQRLSMRRGEQLKALCNMTVERSAIGLVVYSAR